MAQAEPKKRTGAVKKSNPDNKKNKSQQQNALTRYWREVRGEMRKVTWPTREEAQRLTIIVIVFLTLFAAFLGVLDYLWSTVLEALIRFIVGA